MVKFGFKGHEVNYPNWSKHHKTLGLLVKRVYKDGTEILPNDETLKSLVIENAELLKSKHVTLIDRKTDELKKAVDYYLPLTNLEYQETNLDYYSVGSMNTKQTTRIRATFLIEDSRFILDYSYKSDGSFATSFYQLLDMDGIEDILQEVIEQGQPIKEVGIAEGEEEDFRIVAVTDIGEIVDFEIEKRELINSLVGIEIYQFCQEITEIK